MAPRRCSALPGLFVSAPRRAAATVVLEQDGRAIWHHDRGMSTTPVAVGVSHPSRQFFDGQQSPHLLLQLKSYVTPVMRKLARALSAVRNNWVGRPAGDRGGRRLSFCVHIMTESCPRAGMPGFIPKHHPLRSECSLPLYAWRRILAADADAGASLEVHIDKDPLATMHHLIGADVLVTTLWSFSNAAMLCLAGVKLTPGTFFWGPREAERANPPRVGKPVCRVCSVWA